VSATLAPGDTLLLCSDGLHSLVAERELARVLGRDDLKKVVADLIALANAAGGSDNITVLIARGLAD
jgi:protein phosphatase